MKNKNITWSLLLMFTLLSATLVTLAGEVRTVTAFSAIDLSGPLKVILIQGDKEQVEVEADADLLPKIITKVENGVLKIYHKEKNHVSGDISVTVSFKNIESLDCSGAINLVANTPIKVGDFNLDLSGASKIKMDLTCSDLSIDISGAGNATLNGKAKSVDIDISGTGSLSAANLEANDYDIDISGAGNAKINVISTLDVSISGAGSVTYSGEPKIQKEISGSGSLQKMKSN